MNHCEHRRQRVVQDDKGARVQQCEFCDQVVALVARPPKRREVLAAEKVPGSQLPNPAARSA